VQGSDDAKRFFETHFQPVRYGDDEAGLLTGYFEPHLRGSRSRSPHYPVPVYRRPPDLTPLPADHPLRKKGLTAGRIEGDDFIPYPTRQAIAEGGLQGQGLELLFVSDPIDAFVMHVQGSGLVLLDDGSRVRLTFDGKNGHPYTSVTRIMVKEGLIREADAFLDGMISYLRAHPARAAELLSRNESFIFFREMPGGAQGPVGSSGAILTPVRSLAADPAYIPAGAPVWLVAPSLPGEELPIQRLAIAQDTGSAIVGAQRGDLYIGEGEEAGFKAGRMRHPCQFIVLEPVDGA
jgi:membrane-bound lytic murein transglycosylase A